MAQIHDASTGFHDIKPLPEFKLSYLPSLQTVLIVAAIVAAFLWFVRRPKVIPTTPPLPPNERALQSLASLAARRDAKTIFVRDFASTLSLILRQYAEETLRVHASEQTVSEVVSDLGNALKAEFRLVPESKRSDVLRHATRTLRLCERATFADDAEIMYRIESEEFGRAIEDARSAVTTIHAWIEEKNRVPK